MNKGYGRLLYLSSMMSNRIHRSNYMPIFNHLLLNSRPYSEDSLVSIKTITLNDNARNILEYTKLLDNPLEFLRMIETNFKGMDAASAVTTMNLLSKKLTEGSPSQIRKVKESKEFDTLCTIIHKNIRKLTADQVINALKSLNTMMVETETVIVQSLLQILLRSINELTASQIVFANHLLRSRKRIPLIEAITTALPVVFDNQIHISLNRDKISCLSYALEYALLVKNKQAFEIVVNAILKYDQEVNIGHAAIMHNVLCRLDDPSPLSVELLSVIQDVLLRNTKNFNSQIIDKLIYGITMKVREGNTWCYNEQLMDILVNKSSVLDVGFPVALRILRNLNTIKYSTITLLDYLAATCFRDQSPLLNCTLREICTFVQGFIMADYKPVFWDNIRELILNTIEEKRIIGGELIYLALYLTALDCYSRDLIQKAFTLNILELDTRNRHNAAKALLELYQNVKTLYPTYTGPWPSESTLKYIFSLNDDSDKVSLKKAVEIAVGGPEYVKHNMKSKLGHFIDHVIVLKPNGQLLPIDPDINTSGAESEPISELQFKSEFIEDLVRPIDTQVMLIFNFPNTEYPLNSRRLQSTGLMRLKSVEALTSHSTIAINSTLWWNLPDHEKIPYISQAIKLKYESPATILSKYH